MNLRVLGGLLGGLLAFPACAESDLQLSVSATPRIGLGAGQEVVVSATLRNNGPDAIATRARSQFSIDPQDGFWFDLPAIETPECEFDIVEPDPPPQLGVTMAVASLAVGVERTCAVRLRVRHAPSRNHSTFTFSADAQSVFDPVPTNNTATLTFLFGSGPVARHTIPANSLLGLFMIAMATLGAGLWRKAER